jgi:hypothetical protein
MEQMIGVAADLFNEKGAFCRERRAKCDHHRRRELQTLDLLQAGAQEPLRFLDGNVVIVERVQQIQNHARVWQGGRCPQQGVHLVAGEGAPAKQAIGSRADVRCFSSQKKRDPARLVAIAAIQDGDRTPQAEFSDQGHAFCAGRVRAAQDDQFASLQDRGEIHSSRILACAENRKSPCGDSMGEKWVYQIWGLKFASGQWNGGNG